MSSKKPRISSRRLLDAIKELEGAAREEGREEEREKILAILKGPRGKILSLADARMRVKVQGRVKKPTPVRVLRVIPGDKRE